jgi:hypothetical protein
MYATHLDLSLALYKAIKKIQVKTTRYTDVLAVLRKDTTDMSTRLDLFGKGTLIFNNLHCGMCKIPHYIAKPDRNRA